MRGWDGTFGLLCRQHWAPSRGPAACCSVFWSITWRERHWDRQCQQRGMHGTAATVLCSFSVSSKIHLPLFAEELCMCVKVEQRAKSPTLNWCLCSPEVGAAEGAGGEMLGSSRLPSEYSIMGCAARESTICFSAPLT